MAFDIDYFLKINNTYGTTNKKQTQLYNIKNHVNDRFDDTIDCYSVKLNNLDRQLLIIRTVKQDEKIIKSRPNEEFTVGDYVSFDDKTWLVMTKDECNQVYTTGMIKLCNYILKFQSPSGTILSYPCIDETSSTIGVSENDKISTLNGIHRIKLPFDDNTKLIREDRRFFIDKSGTNTAKVTDVNNTEFNYGDKGIIELTLQKDSSYNPMTDINGVCNYFEPIITPTPPEDEGYSSILISGNLVVGGRERTLTPTFYENDGTVNTDVTAIWNIDYNGIAVSNFVVIYSGNLLVIKVKENYELIGQSITVGVSDGNGGYIGELEITIESGW
jgi:hypothetical protein